VPPKIIFRALNRAHIFLYRSSGGKILGSIAGSPVLLLTTTGRKTGKSRVVPLIYTHDGKCYSIIATDHPGWYVNLKNQAQISIEIKGEKITVTARDAHADEELRLWTKFIDQSPAFKSFKEQGHHQLVILEPVQPLRK
jgi:deazaflavin-dependent oxidoreductase (nitroreductase family)